MRHNRRPDFENLEDRKLLSRASAVPPRVPARPIHAAAVAPALPLVLDGTLNVNQKGATSAMDSSGGTTTTTPVSGNLAGVGQVRGIWNQSVDSFGSYAGPDTIQLHNAKGAFVIVFNSSMLGKGHKVGKTVVYNEMPQKLYVGSKAYAKATETGTIQLATNASQSVLQTMKLTTKS